MHGISIVLGGLHARGSVRHITARLGGPFAEREAFEVKKALSGELCTVSGAVDR